MRKAACKRLLALDVHPQRFAFAMFEGRDELVDWGIKASRHGGDPVKVSLNVKLASLLDWYMPDCVVIKTPNDPVVRRQVRMIAALAKYRRISVRRISAASILKAFPGNSKNKFQIATAITTRFPDLLPRLGRKRRLWEAEKYSMSIFDAVALGMAHYETATTGITNDETFSALPR